MALNTYSLDLEAGSTQYASRVDSASLSITSDISIEAWIKIESTGTYTVAAKGKFGTGANLTISYRLRTVTEKLRFAVSDDGTTSGTHFLEFEGSTTMSVGTWYHVSATFNIGTETCAMYIGTSGTPPAAETVNLITGTTLGASIYDSADGFYLGAIENDGGPTQTFDGLVDDLRVWSDIRSQAEIQANYQTEDPAGDNLQANWKLNNDYTDASGNTNTLTAAGSPVFSTDVPFVGTSDAVNRSYTFII